jgi:hypothetical protein
VTRHIDGSEYIKHTAAKEEEELRKKKNPPSIVKCTRKELVVTFNSHSNTTPDGLFSLNGSESSHKTVADHALVAAHQQQPPNRKTRNAFCYSNCTEKYEQKQTNKKKKTENHLRA